MSELRDKITEALTRLGAEDGFQIMEELPCCHDCAIYQMMDEGLQARDGYCFYHSHDVKTMDLDQATYLSWGSSDADAELIVRRMRDAGLEASWDGDRDHRVHVRLPS